MTTLKVKLLNEKAAMPRYMSYGAAAMDLTCTEVEHRDNGTVCCHTGIAVEIPHGCVGLLFPRSSICKTDLRLTNCVGVIDSDYRGEIMAVFDQLGSDIYNVGDRCCQLMIVSLPSVNVQQVGELSGTARGTGGYGSTGK